jgi:D-inositol-3-phosphate glycosyltransferase
MSTTFLSFPWLRRLAVLSFHTSPLAVLGGEKTGGMNVYVREFCRELARHGVLIDIFTRQTAADQPLIDQRLGKGVRVIHLPAGPIQPLAVEQISQYVAEFTKGVLAYAATAAIRYDLIHSHYWLSGLVAAGLRQQWGPVPLVQMFHTLGHLKNRVAQREQEQAPQERLEGECQVVALADRLIAATPAERTQLIHFYGADPAKIVIIPPGVDLARFRAMAKEEARKQVNLPGERKHILFTGRIEPLKGIDTLLQATALLHRRRPELMQTSKVTIIGGDLKRVGQDPELTRLYELRCNLNLCNVVGFVGAKEQEELAAYLAAADLVVMPSHYESFGMVALEAMATGTPVIASAVGGLADLVQHGETGLTVPPRDPEALAAGMDELLSNSEFRHRLGRQASLYARRYDWAQIVRRMVDEVYAPLIQLSNSPPALPQDLEMVDR